MVNLVIRAFDLLGTARFLNAVSFRIFVVVRSAVAAAQGYVGADQAVGFVANALFAFWFKLLVGSASLLAVGFWYAVTGLIEVLSGGAIATWVFDFGANQVLVYIANTNFSFVLKGFLSRA